MDNCFSFGGTRNTKRGYDLTERCREYKRLKLDFRIKEKSFEDLKNTFIHQHKKLQSRKQKYYTAVHSVESCRKKRRVEAGENRRDTKLVSLENRAERAELKYRIALSSAEKKFAILETAYTMFERSLLDFQNERLKLITWSLDANHNIKNETGKG